jgi:hypothetical protein
MDADLAYLSSQGFRFKDDVHLPEIKIIHKDVYEIIKSS